MKKLLVLALLLTMGSTTAAQLVIGDNVRLLTVNGEPISAHKKKLQLSNGLQILGLKFESLIVLSNEDHRFYRSSLHYLKVNVSDDQNYTIDAKTDSLKQAEMFSKKPQFQLTNSSGQQVEHKIWSREQLINKLLMQE